MSLDNQTRDSILAAIPNLRAFAISLSGNVDRADDLVQETVLRALANIDSFQPGTNMPAWLFTILRNLFRSEYRKRRREVEDTDVLIITTPMHNFTVPAALKLWIDHVLRINRTFESTPAGKVGLMKDRPTFVLVGSGGFHSGERARQPDFLTPYVRYALESIGIRSINFILMQGLVGGDTSISEALLAARNALSRHAPFNRVAPVLA